MRGKYLMKLTFVTSNYRKYITSFHSYNFHIFVIYILTAVLEPTKRVMIYFLCIKQVLIKQKFLNLKESMI